MLKTPLCDLFGVEYPIIQGGVAWLATTELAAAVSEAVGLDRVDAGNAPPEFVEQPITNTGDMTSKTFDVNVVLLSSFAARMIELDPQAQYRHRYYQSLKSGYLCPRLKEA